MITPWQSSQWQHLLAQHRQGRLPHSLLFTGQAGLGKLDLARAFAERLLCLEVDNAGGGDSACGRCRSCQLIGAGNHPDLIRLQPEERGKAIKVDQIRTLIEVLGQTAQQGGHQVVIIEPADAMNIAAANALLKTLEEPAGQVVLILVSSQPASLPATIRSRCQTIAFRPPARKIGETWLREHLCKDIKDDQDTALLLGLADGAPLQALALAQEDALKMRDDLLDRWSTLRDKGVDPVRAAGEFLECDFNLLSHFLTSWIMDIIRFKCSDDPTMIVHRDHTQQCQTAAQQLSLTHLYHFLDKLAEAKRLLSAGINLNRQLLLEGLFIEWSQASC